MSDFKQVIKWLKEGKKVTREGWLYFINANNVIYGYKIDEPTYEGLVYLTRDIIEATDWEIYKEEDNWNIENQYNIKNCYDRDDIKTLKEKIDKDITFMLKEILDNKHQTNAKYSMLVNHYRQILDKRFGF